VKWFIHTNDRKGSWAVHRPDDFTNTPDEASPCDFVRVFVLIRAGQPCRSGLPLEDLTANLAARHRVRVHVDVHEPRVQQLVQ
jgi:hypothetical protein